LGSRSASQATLITTAGRLWLLEGQAKNAEGKTEEFTGTWQRN